MLITAMNWYNDLYVGEAARRKKNKIINKLDKHSISFGVYVVTLASNGKDILDVLPAFMLYKQQNQDRLILGLAVTKEEALEVCAQIIQDVYRKTGTYDVRSYFS